MSSYPYLEKCRFKSGDRVKVVSCEKYKGRYVGFIGSVRTTWGNQSIGVLLDQKPNANSKHSCFYFTAAELELIKESLIKITEEDTMKKCTNYINVARMQFEDDFAFNTIAYANYIPDLKVGDLCVVKTQHHGLALAHVAEIAESTGEDLYREIVAKVDISEHLARVERREKAAKIKEQMQARAKQLQDVALYQMLAKDDPDMALMLAEYQELSK